MKDICTLLLFFLCLCNGYAQNKTNLRLKYFNTENTIAIKGYDAVAYFVNNKAVKGIKENAVMYDGIIYYFSSITNKNIFKGNPSKYEPEYGGWCAYAMGATGEKVSINPETFKIINGRLFLFYNKLFNNTLTDWNKDEVNLQKNANANWTKIFH